MSDAEGGAVRAFIALELPATLRRQLADLRTDLEGRFPRLRWVRPEGVHLTLRFLGPSQPGQLRRLGEGLRGAAEACPACDAEVSGLGMFPAGGSPRVLWVGIQVPPPILALQLACENLAASAGFVPERRPFRPHLTLGRWRQKVSRPSLPGIDLGRTRLEELVLFRSDLEPGGAVYTPLAPLPLGGTGGQTAARRSVTCSA